MSETDDTDVLLLIPPNFFLVQSSSSENSFLESSRTVVHRPVSCTAQALDKLFNQVNNLESRLDSLVLSDTVSSYGTLPRRNTLDTTNSFDDRSLDRKFFTFPRRRRRKVRKGKGRQLSITSLDSVSTHRNRVPLLHLRSETSKTSVVNDTHSMDGDLSSIVSTPSKKTDKLLLHEIDEFLTKVESYESPESKERQILNPENVLKATHEYLTQKFDSKSDGSEIKLPSGRTVSSNMLDKYICLVKNNAGQPDKSQLTSSTCKDQYNEVSNSKSLESSKVQDGNINKSPSMRKLNFSDKDVQPTSTPKRTQTYTNTFRPTSNKIYDRASRVLEQHKSNYSRNTLATDSYSLSPNREEFKMPQMRPYVMDNKEGTKLSTMQNKLMDSIDTDLLSLSEMWGERGPDKGERGDSIKLEEERLKREHCESIIQQLQKKVLEQQEKLAVAIKVDRAKDTAISRLREACLKVTGSLDRAEERHRTGLEKMEKEVENFKAVAEESQKKTNHFEAELYKALDLAHDYQDKCKKLNLETKELKDNFDRALASEQETINNKNKEIELLKENYETVMRLNKQSTDCVKNLEDALEKEKSDHNETKSKTSELGRKIQVINDETSLILQEKDVLKSKVNEERARCNMLDRQLCEKQNQCSELLRKCDNLESELKSVRVQLEQQKSELKSHYQRQLEEAVACKLQQFQQQLDAAERGLRDDARRHRDDLLVSCSAQLASLEDQHKLEINILEEKQREEIKLYRLQLAQASEKIELLESKVESHRRRRGAMAAQLHGVMQAQWRQALHILTGERPGAHSSHWDVSSDAVQSAAGAAAVGGGAPDAFSDSDLQHYVQLLLSQPPTRDVTEEPTSDRADRAERPRAPKRSPPHPAPPTHPTKPPWKA